VSGVKVAYLVNTRINHKFVSAKTTKTIHHNLERNTTMYKVVKSIVELKVGSCFGNRDLKVAPLDDHALVLGHEFIIFSKGFLLPHVSFLVFLDEAKIPSITITMNRKLG
jgi:hypothetical protein